MKEKIKDRLQGDPYTSFGAVVLLVFAFLSLLGHRILGDPIGFFLPFLEH